MPIPSEGSPTILNILTIKSCHQYIRLLFRKALAFYFHVTVLNSLPFSRSLRTDVKKGLLRNSILLVAALYLSYEIKLIFQNCLSKSLSAASGASSFAITVLKSSSLILSLESIVFSIFNLKGTPFLAITCLYVI